MTHQQEHEIRLWIHEAKAIKRRFRRKMTRHVCEPFMPSPVEPKRKRETNGMGERYDPSKARPPQPVAEIVRRNYRGVVAVGRSFKAQITVKGRNIALGLFKTPEAAAKAFDEAAIKRSGEKAVLNFPREA